MADLTPQQALDLAMEHHRAGRLAPAAEIYRQLHAMEPGNADLVQLLGVAAFHGQQYAEAREWIGRAIAMNPNAAPYHNNLGTLLLELGEYEAALTAYAAVLRLEPENAVAWFNSGVVHGRQRQWPAAIEAYRKALHLRPEYPTCVLNLGTALAASGQIEAGIALYRAELQRCPQVVAIATNLGNLHKEIGDADAAIATYRAVLAREPRHALPGASPSDGAIASRHFADAHNNLGIALKERGELDEALAEYRRALQVKPDLVEAHSNLIFTLDLLETASLAQQQEERRRWYEQHGRRFAAQIAPHENARDPERKLRVGYVSADFRRHSAYGAFGPVVCGHDPAEVEVYGYSEVQHEDEVTARLRSAATAWHSTVGMPDDALAQQIRRDRIDILVDLSGHSAGNRLLVFARKPAPVQVTAWGHATGTGLQTMDYFFADPVYVPAEQRGLFAEEVIDLPCFLCYEPPEYLPAVTALPASEGNPLTYGCANRLEKITDRVIALWGRILQASPGARLLVKDKRLSDAGVRQAFLGRVLRCGGIEESRVLFFGASPHAEHLKIFHRIDIGLDPFPQSGGASTGEALWMGVPVVTLPGATPSGRCAAAILSAVGLRDWIAQSDEEYVRIAVEAGCDLARVGELRKELRTLLAASAYGDVRRYTHAVEAAYRQMWRRWCAR